MNELDHSSQVEALFTVITQDAGHQQHQRRAQALAAGGDDVLRHLGHQRNLGLKPARNDHVQGFHVARNQGKGSGSGSV